MPVALGGEEGRDKLRKAAGGANTLIPQMSEWGNPCSDPQPRPVIPRKANAGN
jgi:hypothetical protein